MIRAATAAQGAWRWWATCGAVVTLLIVALATIANSAASPPPPAAAAPPPPLLDDFESIAAWSAVPADGVEMRLTSEAGVHGKALRVDFDFTRGSGYAVIRRALDLALPANYAFAFRLRGECLVNDLEFKLVDSTGDNVWWCNRRGYEFPQQWKTIVTKRRQIEFAWGPKGGGALDHVAALEIAITAGKGGRGTVWLDDLELRELGLDGPPIPVAATASSYVPGHEPTAVLDADSTTYWNPRRGDYRPWIAFDFGAPREFGGLVIDWWMSGRRLTEYAVETSEDGASWETVREVQHGRGARDVLYLPETEARRVRIRALGAPGRWGPQLTRITFQPLEWARTPSQFFEIVARGAPSGDYPRALSGQQSYWTVTGTDSSPHEALLGEDGALEAGKAGFSVEPFVFAEGRLWTWHDAQASQDLEGGDLPIPIVRWAAGALALEVTVFPIRDDAVLARYRVTNVSPTRARGTLYLALRPFQVNPPAQFLNTPGGVSPIRSIRREGASVIVNGDRRVECVTAPGGFGASTYDGGNIVAAMRRGALPLEDRVTDSFGYASAALAYPIDLAAGKERVVDLIVPLSTRAAGGAAPTPRAMDAAADTARATWRRALDRVSIQLPDTAAEIARTLRAQIGYILVNRDGPAIQPGSRAYARSWIRDGALTCSALLRVGHADAARAFLDWFGDYQFANGKVPCCVDHRGPDPVPENDSPGEYVYLVAETYRLTHDRTIAERHWSRVAAAVGYLDSLRHTRRTPEYRKEGQRQFYGLLTPSISHEGYSAKPMHSYWDDLFALRGFGDAAFLAHVLGRAADEARIQGIHDEFERDLRVSIETAMAVHTIDYVPGCADLGDFDATSTTIALSPVQADRAVPAQALERTFERYWTFFDDRRAGRAEWDAFTPYEMRAIGSFVRLGRRDRANALLDWFMTFRRPPGFRAWAEVVGRDARGTRFIGDLPHTWVGSDFVRSVLDMIAYERERDDALVLGAGIPWSWLEGEGVRVRGLVTRWGALDFTARSDGQGITVNVGGVTVPSGGIRLVLPRMDGPWWATVNGVMVLVRPSGDVVLRAVPASVRLEPSFGIRR